METEDNATAHHVPGLQPFTTYMFRVAARNALGFSKPSRESYPTMSHREREYYRVTILVGENLQFTEIWDVLPSCLGSRQLQ